MLGYRVMETVGRDITDINFSRGFAIELGSTLSVVLASVVGTPYLVTQKPPPGEALCAWRMGFSYSRLQACVPTCLAIWVELSGMSAPPHPWLSRQPWGVSQPIEVRPHVPISSTPRSRGLPKSS